MRVYVQAGVKILWTGRKEKFVEIREYSTRFELGRGKCIAETLNLHLGPESGVWCRRSGTPTDHGAVPRVHSCFGH